MNIALGLFATQGIPNEIIGHIITFLDFRSAKKLAILNIVLDTLVRVNVSILDNQPNVSVDIFQKYPNLSILYTNVSVVRMEELDIVLSKKRNWINVQFQGKMENIDSVASYVRTHRPDYISVQYRGGRFLCYSLTGGRYYLDYKGAYDGIYPDSVRSIPYNAIDVSSIAPYGNNDWVKRTGRLPCEILTFIISHNVRSQPMSWDDIFEAFPNIDTVISSHTCRLDISGPMWKIKHLLLPHSIFTIRDDIVLFRNLETVGISLKDVNQSQVVDRLKNIYDPQVKHEILQNHSCIKSFYKNFLVDLKRLYPKITFVPIDDTN